VRAITYKVPRPCADQGVGILIVSGTCDSIRNLVAMHQLRSVRAIDILEQLNIVVERPIVFFEFDRCP
jgi:hypothetical protein